MRYLVLLRYGLSRLYPVLAIDRSSDGRIACTETMAPTLRMAALGSDTPGNDPNQGSQRIARRQVTAPRVVYSIPGPRLLDSRLPEYTHDMPGATVQISGHAVLEEPDRVSLQLLLVPSGQQPLHRETVGDRCIEDGNPAMWIVLARHPEDQAAAMALRKVLRWPPPLGATVRP